MFLPVELWDLILRKLIKIDITFVGRSRLISKYFNEIVQDDAVLRRKLIAGKYGYYGSFSSITFKDMSNNFSPTNIKGAAEARNLSEDNLEIFIVQLYGFCDYFKFRLNKLENIIDRI